jgi:AraC family transcriptional regulator of arabinose operon
MPIYKETPAPPAGPLHAGYQDARGLVHGWRPKGTKDWLLVYTELGDCLVRYPGGELKMRPGDIFLYQPGTPQDYGQHDKKGRWKQVWVHWIPGTPVLEWLAWPELSPGLKHLFLPVEIRRMVLKELSLTHSALRSNVPQKEFLATNAVERALLYCSQVNPREENPRRHPRIQQAADELAQNTRDQLSLETIARRFGFSRSRFATLFRQQMGQPPGQYLESQRLVQARHLLAYTNQTLAQIADHVGFSSPFYLSLRFKKHYGQSPRDYRQQRPAPDWPS